METIITSNTENIVEVWRIDEAQNQYRVSQSIPGLQLKRVQMSLTPFVKPEEVQRPSYQFKNDDRGWGVGTNNAPLYDKGSPGTAQKNKRMSKNVNSLQQPQNAGAGNETFLNPLDIKVDVRSALGSVDDNNIQQIPKIKDEGKNIRTPATQKNSQRSSKK